MKAQSKLRGPRQKVSISLVSICGIFFACRELVCTTVAKVSIGPGSVGVAGTSIGVTATPIMIIAASACPTRKNGSESNPRNSLSDSFGGVRAARIISLRPRARPRQRARKIAKAATTQARSRRARVRVSRVSSRWSYH